MSRQTPPIKRKTSIIVIMFSTKKEELISLVSYPILIIIFYPNPIINTDVISFLYPTHILAVLIHTLPIKRVNLIN